jgi:hypothetical protein
MLKWVFTPVEVWLRSGRVAIMQPGEPKLIKLIVRRAGSNKFLRATGRWTKKAEAAFNFPNLVSAIHTCMAKNLRQAELILRYDSDRSDRRYVLPMP